MNAAKVLLLVLLATTTVHADDLTKMIQEDLVTLGYEPGNVTGEATIPTVVAISKFQSEHDLEVTGESTPQLAGIIKAQISKSPGTQPNAVVAVTAMPVPTVAAAPVVAASTPAADPNKTDLQIAQQECLQRKYEKEQAKAQKKRGIGSLVRAITRTAGQTGNIQTATEISETSNDIYSASATAADLESAAKDLGLSKSQVEKCRDPS